MLKPVQRSCFNIVLLLLLIVAVQCNETLTGNVESALTFMVVNAGQGSAAIAVAGDSALVFDVGPAEGFDSLLAGYTALGSLPVSALFLSHSDNDHAGALSLFCSKVRWTGALVVTHYADTSFLLKLCKTAGTAVHVERFREGGVITFGTTTVTCLWPDTSGYTAAADVSASENNLSMVIRIQHGATSIIIPGDIDTSVTRKLSGAYAAHLQSDLLIVPHHGSRSAADPVFYGFVNPSQAIISAGKNNEYGHPHQEVLELLTACSIPFRITSHEGSTAWRSNGFYWAERF